MKRLVVVAAVFSVAGIFVGRLTVQGPANAEGPADRGRAAGDPVNVTCEFGDVNADGNLDISDSIFLLRFLFGESPGGPDAEPPRPCVFPRGQLPATGQTKCYDANGAEISCDSPDFPGQEGFYQAGCPSEGRFVDHGDGTVTDTCTGLEWQKDTADVNGNGSIGDEDHLSWQGALNYCENLSFAGHSDWRLPNVRELQSIVDYGRETPAIDPVFEAVSYWYWSSTTCVDNPGYAWIGDFDVGVVGGYGIDEKGLDYFVRAVRNDP